MYFMLRSKSSRTPQQNTPHKILLHLLIYVHVPNHHCGIIHNHISSSISIISSISQKQEPTKGIILLTLTTTTTVITTMFVHHPQNRYLIHHHYHHHYYYHNVVLPPVVTTMITPTPTPTQITTRPRSRRRTSVSNW